MIAWLESEGFYVFLGLLIGIVLMGMIKWPTSKMHR
jgi:hypothetical protein